MLGHEDTVGQDGTHDEHAEERGTSVKEATGGLLANPHRGPTEKAVGGSHPQTTIKKNTRNHGRTLPRKPQKGLPQKVMGGAAGSHSGPIQKSTEGAQRKLRQGPHRKPQERGSQATTGVRRVGVGGASRHTH